MTLRYKRSYQLAREIDEAALKLGYLEVGSIKPEEMEGIKTRKQLYGPNGELIARVTKVSLDKQPCQHNNLRHPEPVCNMKYCWCRQPDYNMAERDDEPVKPKNRVTWDKILSQQIDPHDKVDNSRPVIPSKDISSKQRQYDNNKWDPVEFVDELSRESPGDLLGLKIEIDKAAKRMGLDEYFPREAPKEKSRSRAVVDYLEDLTVEMLKKRLEESETRNKNMRQKLEDALVAQKLEIQSLKSELFIKNEEVADLREEVEDTLKKGEGRDSLKREMEFIQRVTSLDERLKSMMEKDERTNEQIEKYERLVSELKSKLTEAVQARDLYKAKMEIYQTERDKAIASLSVYERTFRKLQSELGQELREFRPFLDLTADSRGTLDSTGREFRGIATSSPNTSMRRSAVIDERRKSPQRRSARSKKRTKHTLVDSAVDGSPLKLDENKENVGEALLQQLQVLGKEFKQFSENVLPLAIGLEDEAHQLLDVSTSTGMSWSDLPSQSGSSSRSLSIADTSQDGAKT